MALISGKRDQDRFLLPTTQRGDRTSLSFALSLELPLLNMEEMPG